MPRKPPGKERSTKRSTKPKAFIKNKLFKEKAGFAFKIPASLAVSRFKLKPKLEDLSPGATGFSLVWVSPDGKRILTKSQAEANNSRRRASRTLSDAWADFKAADPTKAKEIGWNKFQTAMKGIKGSKIGALQKFQTQFGLSYETYSELEIAADGDTGERNGWGDSP